MMLRRQPSAVCTLGRAVRRVDLRARGDALADTALRRRDEDADELDEELEAEAFFFLEAVFLLGVAFALDVLALVLALLEPVLLRAEELAPLLAAVLRFGAALLAVEVFLAVGALLAEVAFLAVEVFLAVGALLAEVAFLAVEVFLAEVAFLAVDAFLAVVLRAVLVAAVAPLAVALFFVRRLLVAAVARRRWSLNMACLLLLFIALPNEFIGKSYERL